ncbi:MAG: c-type cytochrome [Terriglobia bacterium]
MKFGMRMFSVTAALAVALGIAASARAASKDSGADVYKAKCAMCHGTDGKGLEPLHTPDFTDPKWQKEHSDQYIVDTIKNGKKGTMMMAFGSKLSATQIQDLLHYIRSFNSAKK